MTDKTFLNVAERFFQDRIGPRLLLELRAGRVNSARRILSEREAKDLELRLRQAPREVTT